MAELLMMVMLFLKPIFSILLSIFGIEVESGQLGILYAAAAAVTFLYLISVYGKNLRTFSKFSLWYIITCLIVLGGILLTVLRYGGLDGDLRGSFLSFGSAVIPSFLLSVEIRKRNRLCELGKIVPIIVLALSIVALLSLFVGSYSLTGLARNTNNINYQNGSYYLAYAFGLNLYYLRCSDRMHSFRWVDKIRPAFYVLAVLQFAGVFLFGGRGGMVLLLFLGVYFLFSSAKNKASLKKRISTVAGVSVLAIVVFIWIGNSSVNLTGLKRIFSFLKNIGDSNRMELYRSALRHFAESPLIGNGIGSVYYTVGFYSHNLFTDFLCETGILGTLVLLFAIVTALLNQHRLNRLNPLNQFSTIIFICGFTLAMFSGYYMSNQMLWFAIGFSLPSIRAFGGTYENPVC